MAIKRIGMRNIKTGISVGLAIFAGNLGLVHTSLFTAAACLTTVKGTVKSSLETGVHRITGTILGGIVGFIFAHIDTRNGILGGLGVSTIIYLCNTLKINNSIPVATLTFLSIILGVGDNNIFEYSLGRTWDTGVGVIIGVIINYAMNSSGYFNKMIKEFILVKREYLELVELKLLSSTVIELSEIEDKLHKLEKVYNKFNLEVEYSIMDIESERLYRILDECKRIYFHVQGIDFLEHSLCLSHENYAEVISLYPDAEIIFKVEDNKSHVFNYHIKMILKSITKIRRIKLYLV